MPQKINRHIPQTLLDILNTYDWERIVRERRIPEIEKALRTYLPLMNLPKKAGT